MRDETPAAAPRASAKPRLQAIDVDVDYPIADGGYQRALSDVSLEVRDGEFVSIVGPSGCGKTTLLSAVDGLLPISGGRILLDQRDIDRPGADRSVVFQDPSLLPWRTILRNVSYGLEIQHVPKAQARKRARDLIELVGLAGYEHRYPRQLSGGMKQRVNLARALAMDPEILLLDEPFAALDAQTREHMQAELLSVWAKSRKTALLVTHQIDEAIYLSDRVIVLTQGPGTVKADITIDLERPRGLEMKRSDAFVQYERQVWGLIQSEKGEDE